MSPARGLRRDRAIFAIFFIHALAGGGIFARIPDIQLGAGLSEAALGLALAAAAAGGLVVLPFAGRSVQRLGTRTPIAICLPLMTLAHITAALAGGLAPLVAALVVNGAAFSVSNVAMNVEADRIEAAGGARVMNRCHGAWALGMLLASVLGVGARAVPVAPAWHFLAVLPLVAAVSAAVLAAMDPAPRRGTGATRRGPAMPDRATLLLTLFGLSASVAQGGAQNWSVIFMREEFAAPDWVDTLTLPAFLATLALGRLYADTWVARAGPVALARAMAGVALAGGLLVTAAPGLWAALAGFALLGLGIASLFPLTVSAAARLGHRPPEDSVSAVILATGLAMLAAPAALGWVAEVAGLRTVFAAILPFFVATLALSRLAGNT